VNAIIPPLAIDGPCVSIRRFGSRPLQFDDLIKNESVLQEMVEFITGCVRAKLNILISGGTGSGKTTLLNALSSFIPEVERIVTIEDSAELQLQQIHVVRLETRPPNIEGKGEVTQRDLVKNCLRMRPDRIILGEVRAGEALDMLQAMNTGHEGSLTTIHANSTRDALSRLETMVAMAGLDLPDKAIRQQVASAIDIIIQASRLPDGKRKVVTIAEITGMEGDIITSQEVFTFDQLGVLEDGTVLGAFRSTGIRPRCMDRLEAFGVRLPEKTFAIHKEVPSGV
jgi:pilus assembly protein CpaF